MVRYRIRSLAGRGTGSPKRFAVEVYLPAPGKYSWLVVKGGFKTYEHAREWLAQYSQDPIESDV